MRRRLRSLLGFMAPGGLVLPAPPLRRQVEPTSVVEALAGDFDRVAGDLDAVMTGHRPAGSQLEAAIPYMSPSGQRLVRSSLAAWERLPESERRVPTSL